MNSSVYHLVGPTGVKHATSRIKQVLEEEKPSAAGKRKRYSNAAKEPWVLVTSLSQA